MNYVIKFKYRLGDIVKEVSGNNHSFDNNDVSIKLISEEVECGLRYKAIINPKNKIQAISFNISKNYPISKTDVFMANGYQSWTLTTEYLPNEKMTGLSTLAKMLNGRYRFSQYGDYTFKKYTNKKGVFHGFTYSYIRSGKVYKLFASLNDFFAYTIINVNCKKNLLWIESDIEDLIIENEITALDFLELEGNEDKVFSVYKKYFNVPKVRVSPTNGFCSWYNYYQDINEEIINTNIREISKAGFKLFQIDDGYQTFVGDFLTIDKKKFPNGIKPIVEKIHSLGMKAGVWMAPISAEVNSVIAKEHPDWLIKDKKGNSILVGCSWSRHYVYDIYNPEVREYVKKLFEFMVVENKFDYLKLDFLYTACIYPRTDKTRAQIMRDTMEFFRENTFGAEILGCGVPLVSAAGTTDYCRIGADVSLKFDDHWYMKMAHRERISTKNTLLNTIFRRHLNDFWFLNDPDVYLLRDDNMWMNDKQKEALTVLNHIFGGLYLTSDNLRYYDEKKSKAYEFAASLKDYKYSNVERIKNFVYFDLTDGTNNYKFSYNIKNGILDYQKQ
jgi:alpha-galactosidase